MPGQQYVFLAAIVVAGLAAWFDWRTGQIPNWLTLGCLGTAFPAHAVLGYLRGGGAGAGKGLIFAALGVLVCGLIPLLLFRASAMGGGDLKLLTGVGALLGPVIGIEAQMYSFIAGALYAPARLAYEGKLFATFGNTVGLVKNFFVPKDRRKKIPKEMMSKLRFGPAVLVGTVLAAGLHWRLQ